jgi:hypothetical protein
MALSLGNRYGEAMTDPTSLPNFPPPPDEHPLRGRVLDALIDQGLGPDIDSDGDVAFTVQDQQLFVRCSEGELQLMRVFGQWAISDAIPADPLKRLQTCNELTLQLNIVKAGLANNTLVVTGEHIVTPQTDVSTLLGITIQLVLAGVQMWHERILGTGGDAGPGAGQPGDGGLA